MIFFAGTFFGIGLETGDPSVRFAAAIATFACLFVAYIQQPE